MQIIPVRYIEAIKDSILFQGIDANDIESLFHCFQAELRIFANDEFIWMMGDRVEKIGIIVSGEAYIIKEDIMGNRSIMSQIGPKEVFGEAIVCSVMQRSPVSVVTKGDCHVIFLRFLAITHRCRASCTFHGLLIQNMLRILAEKNMQLSAKLEFLGRKSLREKIAAFLLGEYERKGGQSFQIDFDRNALADFLCSDRSALSRELSRMRNEGLIEFRKNEFRLVDIEGLCRIAG